MTWSEFYTKVEENAPVDAARKNSETFFENQVRVAVKRVQTLVTKFQEGHETWFTYGDGTDSGSVTILSYPTGAENVIPQQAWRVNAEYEEEPCIRQPFNSYPWDHRFDLSCARLTIKECQLALAWDRFAREFWVYPNITEDWSVQLFWNGIRGDWDDNDTVPFDAEIADVVADYVKSQGYREVMHDHNAAKEWLSNFTYKMNLIYTRSLDERRMADRIPNRGLDANCYTCGETSS